MADNNELRQIIKATAEQSGKDKRFNPSDS